MPRLRQSTRLLPWEESYWLHTQQQVYSFFCSNLNRVDSHNELCPKTGNLRLFSVWKMLMWDLDITHGQHWLCELECVGKKKMVALTSRTSFTSTLSTIMKWINFSNSSSKETCMWTISNQKNVNNMHVFSILNFQSVSLSLPNIGQTFQMKTMLVLFHDYFNILGHTLGAMFLGRLVVLTQIDKTKCWNELFTWHFSKQGENVCPTCCVFAVWLLSCVHTPHHPELFWKTCYGCWIVTKQQNNNEQDMKWNDCGFTFEKNNRLFESALQTKQNPLQL